uniref:DUF637 domain-containing protein n=1 Tax=Parendozoicomonas sp. Alg238-R29 TaxID=2993446 RepID=UPI00248DEC57
SAEGDLTLQAENGVAIVSVQDSAEFSYKSKSKGSFGRSKSHSIDASTIDQVKGQLTSGETLTVQSGEDILVRASRLEGEEAVNLEAEGTVTLAAAKNSEKYEEHKSKTGTVWQKSSGEGRTDETVVHTEIITPELTIAAQRIEADFKGIEGLTLQESVKQLSQNPELAWMAQLENDPRVDWSRVQEIHDQWDYESEGLTGPAAAVIAIAIAILTSGAGAAALNVAFGTGVGTVGTTTTLAGAIANAGLTSLVSQASISTINNQGDLGAVFQELGSSESVKSLATSMVTAGLLYEPGLAVTNNATIPSVEKALYDAGIRAGVSTAIHGGSLGDNLESSLTSAVINWTGQQLTHQIGNLEQTNADIDAGDWQKTLAHAVVGCAQAKAGGKDCASGALGGATAELLSPWLDSNGLDKKGDELVTLLATVAVAGATGKELDTAVTQALQTDRYNRQLHPNEVVFLADKDRIRRYKKYLADQGIILTEEEAAVRLNQYAAAMLDEKWTNINGRDLSTESFILSEASQYSGYYPDDRGDQHDLFAATNEEYRNELINLKPLFSAFSNNADVRKYISDNYDHTRLDNWTQKFSAGKQAGFNDAAVNGTLVNDTKLIIDALAGAPAYIIKSVLSSDVGSLDDVQMASYYQALLKLQGRGEEAGYVYEYEWTTTQRLTVLGLMAGGISSSVAKAVLSGKVTGVPGAPAGKNADDAGSVSSRVGSDSDFVDVLSPESRKHILEGDGPGSGGHLWPGQPGKTPFPEGWSGDKVVHEVGDIATSPNTKWYAQTGSGGEYTKSGKPAKWVAWEVRDNVRIRVVYEPATGRVVTGFPDSDPIPNLKLVD